jgi:hypothetical protein
MGTRGGKEFTDQRNREREGRQMQRGAGMLTRGGQGMEHWVAGARWSPVRGGRRRGRGNRQRGSEPERGEAEWPLARARAGGLFLKRDMGAPDSLQCLSGAHRTTHSSYPVNHRTAHMRRSSCARGRCTGLSSEPRQRENLDFLIFSI